MLEFSLGLLQILGAVIAMGGLILLGLGLIFVTFVTFIEAAAEVYTNYKLNQLYTEIEEYSNEGSTDRQER